MTEPVRRYLEHALGGAAPARGSRLVMRGRVKAGAWLPFKAVEELDGRSFEWRARVGPLTVVDRFSGGAGSTEGRLFEMFGAADANTSRSAAGRATLEAIWAPGSLLPEHGAAWRAESDDHVVVSLDVPPERPEVHLRIDADGAVRSVSAMRWSKGGYIPCGCLVHAERRFGDVVVPSAVTVGWWFGTPRWAPFFRASIESLRPL